MKQKKYNAGRLFFLLLCIIYLIPVYLNSQNPLFDNFQYLKCSGKVPMDFTILSLEKYKNEKEQISMQDNHFLRKTKDEYLLESSYIISKILLSGKILFNEPLSEYISTIADELLKNEPELRSSLRFYVTKSPSVNAFATDQGIIFVNIGLIAQVEDEAQLAFVLAHEIIHYVKKHGMEYYIEKEYISKGKGAYKRLSMDEQLFATHHRSREMESEADNSGFIDFYTKSNYSLQSILGIFDVLQYAYLPFDDIPFDKDFFETSYLKFPDSYYLEEVQLIAGDEDYDDSKSTHPNIIKRRRVITELLNSHTNEGKRAFIQPEKKFYEIRDLARFEAIRQYLINRDYGNAIYNSYLLLKQYPDNKFLEKSIAKSLYFLAIYKNKGWIYDVLPKYKKIEGESQQLYCFLSQLLNNELSVFSLQYCWNLKSKYPDDEYLESICNDLIKMMVLDQNISLSQFSFNLQDTISSDEINVPDSVPTSKYERIRIKRLKQESIKDDFTKYIFVEAYKDPDFKKTFDYYTQKKKPEDKADGFTFDNTLDDYGQWGGADFDNEEVVERNINTLGLDRIIILDPVYIKLDERKRKNIKFIDSELKLKKYYNIIVNNSVLVNLDINLIGSKSFQTDDIVLYNEFSLLYDWITERHHHEDMPVCLSQSEYLKPLFKKYNTSHIALTGIISVRERKPNKFGTVLWSVFLPYILPFSLKYAISPDFSTNYFFILFNGEIGDIEFTVFRSYSNNDRIDILNSVLYDTFYQIKKEPTND